MPVYVFVPILVVALLAGFGAAYLLLQRRQGEGSSALEIKAQAALSEAETQAKETRIDAREGAVKIRSAAEQEAREYRAQSQQIEKRLLSKEENLDRKGEDLSRRERELGGKEKGLDEVRAQLDDSVRQQEKELQRVANMTRQEASGILMAQVEQELRNEVARKGRESELAAPDESERRALEVGLQGVHPEVARHHGILRFRTSSGQQGLNHSKEVAYLAAMMASEIGADVRIAKLSGLLHDIGKAIDHEVEGSHAVIGADLLQRHGVPAPVVHAVLAHHYDEEPPSMEPLLLIPPDPISPPRPGARRESPDADG